MNHTAISIKGGKSIVQAVKRIALQRTLETGQKCTVGSLVYDAICNTYGDELDEALSFFEMRDTSMNQSIHDGNKRIFKGNKQA